MGFILGLDVLGHVGPLGFGLIFIMKGPLWDLGPIWKIRPYLGLGCLFGIWDLGLLNWASTLGQVMKRVKRYFTLVLTLSVVRI